MVAGVFAAVVAIAIAAVGRLGAGRGGGLGVGYRISADYTIATIAGYYLIVLAIGDFFIRCRGRAFVIVGVFITK